MNVANEELCIELYKLSGWKTGDVIRDNPTQSAYNESNVIAYRYDLGYLLRKLPVVAIVHQMTKPEWRVVCGDSEFFEDTPEDAAIRLCIELFKQGILVKTE